ncbi:MAG: hypothetical protein EPN48_15115 [Microbacteriaceae bacterium]|nr:MAG: hypothetical protein EPN48_15115 [Microbacteriaceae bacterium]
MTPPSSNNATGDRRRRYELLTPGRGSGLVTVWDLVSLAMTGGVKFPVSLVMNELAHPGAALIRDQSVLGVFVGSDVSAVLGGVLLSWRAAHYRELGS